jgi:hypothetical protein
MAFSWSDFVEWAPDVLKIITEGQDDQLDWGKIAGIGGGIAGLVGLFDEDQEKVGYQGKIPDYQAVRSRVPVTWGQERSGTVAQPAPYQRPLSEAEQQLAEYWEANPDALGEAVTANPDAFKPPTLTPTRPLGEVRPTAYTPMTEGRRPGEAGRQYFTDTLYATKPETEPLTLEQAQAQSAAQATQIATDQDPANFAQGGLASLGRYMGGPTDGMADQIPAMINGQQPAAMSDGEFVMPADVVSHLGNGNSEAGANELYAMMDRVRQARTGSKQQGKQINPNDFMKA